MPLHLDRCIFAQFYTLMPQFEPHVYCTNTDLDNKIDAVILLARILPMPILELEIA